MGRSPAFIDGGNYITKLPPAEHDAKEWPAAMEALILVTTIGGSTMFARIVATRALNRRVKRGFNPARKDAHWGRRKLARDWIANYDLRCGPCVWRFGDLLDATLA